MGRDVDDGGREGASLGRKEELMSPIPMKKSSVDRPGVRVS